MDAKTKIEQTAAEIGLTMEAVFVPFSQSRNKGEKNPSLNWRVTLRRNGRDILTTDYGAGYGHCPAYKLSVKEGGSHNSITRMELILAECERGRVVYPGNYTGKFHAIGKPIMPELADVLYSLCMEADAIDSPTFEEWAEDFGYDVDSRSAEKTYRACLETALKLRAGLGDDGLHKLRDVCQDY